MTEGVVVGASAPDLGGDDAGAPIPSWTVHGDITQIAEPWVTALGELKEISRSRTANAGTYSYSYAELGDVLSEARTVLAAHDLAVFQVAEVIDGEVSVSTVGDAHVGRVSCRSPRSVCRRGTPRRTSDPSAPTPAGTA